MAARRFTMQAGEWKPFGMEDRHDYNPEEQEFLYTAEYAKTGRAGCKKCGEKIDKDTVRIGNPIKWRGGGEFGYINAWHHPGCTRAEEKSQAKLGKLIYGLADLKPKDRTALLAELTSSEIPEQLRPIDPDDPDFLKRKDSELEREAQPKALIGTMLPFQEKGLGWLLKQEQGEFKGGILADQMGLGKTIQTIALLLASKANAAAAAASKKGKGKGKPAKGTQVKEEAAAVSDASLALSVACAAYAAHRSYQERTVAQEAAPSLVNGPTLVICPTSAMMQWGDEITTFAGSALDVIVYYGAGRGTSPAALAQADVVLTTYPVVEREWRVCVDKCKVQCKWCDRMFLERSLRMHNWYFCGPNARRTEKQSKTEKRTAMMAKEKAMRTLRIKAGKASDVTEADINDEDSADDDSAAAAGGKGSRKRAKKKATPTTAPVTVTQIYRDVMSKAGRKPVGMYERINNGRNAHNARVMGALYSVGQEIEVADKNPESEAWYKAKVLRKDEASPRVQVHFAGWSKKHDEWIDLDSNRLRVLQADEEEPVKAKGGKGGNKGKGKPVAAAAAAAGEPAEAREPPEDDGDEDVTVISVSTAAERAAAAKAVALDLSAVSNKADRSEAGVTFAGEEPAPKKRRAAARQVNVKVKQESDNKAAVKAESAGPDDEYEEDGSEDEEEDGDLDSDFERPKTKSQTAAKATAKIKKGAAPKAKAKGKARAGAKTKGAATKKRKKRADDDSDGSDDDFVPSSHSEPNESESEDEPYVPEEPPMAVKRERKQGSRGKGKGQAGSASGGVKEEAAEDPFRCKVISDKDMEDIDKVDLSQSTLHNVPWFRIVLDEAHKIKGRTTNVAKAVFALQSEKKWCLSGTPLQNKIGELYSLVRFLRQDKFAFYYCNMKDCKCKSLCWRFGAMSRQCDLCGHPPMKHFSYFNKSVINPIQRNGYVGEGKTAMVTLKNEVLDKIMLRRTKADVAADINLPALSIVVQKVSLKPSELDFYESIYKQTQVKFDDFCLKGTLLHNYAHIFDLLARLRQTCDHPYLVSLGNVKGARASIPTKHTNASAAGDLCGLCQDVVEASTAAVAGCKHVFHSSCITEYTEQVATTKIGCPVCFKPLSVTLAEQKEEKQMLKEQKEDDISKLGPSPRDKPSKRKSKAAAAAAVEEDEEEEDAAAELERALAMSLETTAPAAAAVKPAPAAVAASHKVNGVKLGRNNFMQRMDIGAFTSSSKLDALVDSLQKTRKTSPDHKSIVFSQYTNFLDIIEWKLRQEGFAPVKLVGSMPMTMRTSVLEAFKTNPKVDIILLSLRAGGEGLNLQIASHVFLMDPWWNPAVEMQAIQRAHRIGQTRAVTAVRFMCKDTIEERMLALQEKKSLVFEGTVGGATKALSALSEEDLRFLFKN